jgi:hypothetical protein
VAAGNSYGDFSFSGQALTSGPVLVEYDPNGNVLWVRQAGTLSAFWTGLGVSAVGTVVGSLGTGGTLTWAGSVFTAGPNGQLYAALTAESDGAPRWVRLLPGTNGSGYVLAVDPTGQVALAGFPDESCVEALVLKYNLAGDLLWSRNFRPTDCSHGEVWPQAVALSGRNVVVTGYMDGTTDFGFGPITRSNSDFILNLNP